MQRIEYRADGNHIGLSVKYPEEINRKWSESDVDLQCEECNSENIDSDISGTVLVIACLNCPNYWEGTVSDVLTTHDTEEATISIWDLPFEDADR